MGHPKIEANANKVTYTDSNNNGVLDGDDAVSIAGQPHPLTADQYVSGSSYRAGILIGLASQKGIDTRFFAESHKANKENS